MIVSVKINVAAVRRQIGALTGVLRKKTSLLRAIADQLFRLAKKSFSEQKSPEGKPWATLSQPYGARKAAGLGGGHKKLYRSGALFRSLFAGADRRVAFVEATMPYAAVHQFGWDDRGVMVRAHIRKVSGRDEFATRFTPRGRRRGRQILSGVATVRAHHRNMFIPARPYLPAEEMAQRVGVEMTEEALRDAIAKNQ